MHARQARARTQGLPVSAARDSDRAAEPSVGDIAMARGFVYLAVVLDWFSPRVRAWRLSITIDATFYIEALTEALARYGKPDVFNTDQGSPVRPSPARLSARASPSVWTSRAPWRDNVFVKRLWRSVKYEEVYLRAYDSVSEFRMAA